MISDVQRSKHMAEFNGLLVRRGEFFNVTQRRSRSAVGGVLCRNIGEKFLVLRTRQDGPVIRVILVNAGTDEVDHQAVCVLIIHCRIGCSIAL